MTESQIIRGAMPAVPTIFTDETTKNTKLLDQTDPKTKPHGAGPPDKKLLSILRMIPLYVCFRGALLFLKERRLQCQHGELVLNMPPKLASSP